MNDEQLGGLRTIRYFLFGGLTICALAIVLAFLRSDGVPTTMAVVGGALMITGGLGAVALELSRRD